MEYDVDNILVISVSDSEWLEVVNGDLRVEDVISNEAVADYLATADLKDVDELILDDALFDYFDGEYTIKEMLTMPIEEVVEEHLNLDSIKHYMAKKNTDYCQEEDLCETCRTKLRTGYETTEAWGYVAHHDIKYCPYCD